MKRGLEGQMSSQYELLDKPMPKLTSRNKKAWFKLYDQKLSLLFDVYGIEAVDGHRQWDMLALTLIYEHLKGFRPVTGGGRPPSTKTPEAILGRTQLLDAVTKKKHEHHKKSGTILNDWGAWEAVKKSKSDNKIPRFYLDKAEAMKKGTLKAHLARARSEKQEQEAIKSHFSDNNCPRGLGYFSHPLSPGNTRSDGKP